MIDDHQPNNNRYDNFPTTQINTITRSKVFYESLIMQKYERPKTQNKLCNKFDDPGINFELTYQSKIKCIHDFKMAEFNYKMLNNILPCNKNLKLWGKQQNDECDICGQVHDIYHLLYECDHNRQIWHLVSKVLKLNISLKMILLGAHDQVKDFVISLVAYYIYKYWLICNSECKTRSWKYMRIFFIQELYGASNVYMITKLAECCPYLNMLKYELTVKKTLKKLVQLVYS